MSFDVLYLTPESALNANKGLLLQLAHQVGYQRINWSTSTLTILPHELTSPLIKQYAVEFGVTPKTVRNHLSEQKATSYTGRMAILPLTSWKRFTDEIKDEPYQFKTSLTCAWVYLVCGCWLYQEFTRSAAAMARDLKMAPATLTKCTSWLIAHKFIALKHDKAHYEKISLARVYQLYDVDVPNESRQTMWFIGHLSKFFEKN